MLMILQGIRVKHQPSICVQILRDRNVRHKLLCLSLTRQSQTKYPTPSGCSCNSWLGRVCTLLDIPNNAVCRSRCVTALLRPSFHMTGVTEHRPTTKTTIQSRSGAPLRCQENTYKSMFVVSGLKDDSLTAADFSDTEVALKSHHNVSIHKQLDRVTSAQNLRVTVFIFQFK